MSFSLGVRRGSGHRHTISLHPDTISLHLDTISLHLDTISLHLDTEGGGAQAGLDCMYIMYKIHIHPYIPTSLHPYIPTSL